MIQLEAALFDFDGTITPSLPLWVKSYQTALGKHGVTLSDDEVIRRCFFRDWGEVAKDFAVCTGEEMRAAVEHSLHAEFASAELFPQARAVIELCRENGLRTALVTSASRHLIASVTTRLGLERLFDFVICGDDVANFKPHPEPVLTTLRALACKPAHAIMVGDSRVDILAGKAAGTRTALFLPLDHHRFHDPRHLRATEPDYIFETHDELPAMLGLRPLVTDR